MRKHARTEKELEEKIRSNPGLAERFFDSLRQKGFHLPRPTGGFGWFYFKYFFLTPENVRFREHAME